MSVKIMGLVWEADLPHDEKYVLLAYADHADHQGRHIFPSVGLVAWKTGYSPRQIQRITRDLQNRGILVPDGVGPKGVNRFRIDVEAFPHQAPFVRNSGSGTGAPSTDLSNQDPKEQGDNVSPAPIKDVYPKTAREMSGVASCQGDILTDDKKTGVTNPPSGSDKMSPNPSLNHPLNPIGEEEKESDHTQGSFHESPSTLVSPELLVFFEVTGRYPLDDQTSLVVETLQKHPSTADQLRPYWAAWVARDYRRTNLDWLLNWAVNQSIPGKKNAAENSSPRQKGGMDGKTPLATQPGRSGKWQADVE